MTKRPTDRCAWCGERFARGTGPGRPRRFCKRSHRQRHYEARQAATRLGLANDDVLVSMAEISGWRDRLYLLEAALEDTQQDLGAHPTLRDYADAYVHLLQSALAVSGYRIEPRALGSDWDPGDDDTG